MAFLFFAAIALIGAAVHIHRAPWVAIGLYATSRRDRLSDRLSAAPRSD